jgi:hypothetical protein
MEPWEVFIRALTEAWAEEDIRSGRYGEVQKKVVTEIADTKEAMNERSNESQGSTAA